jgi:hypothetical protein
MVFISDTQAASPDGVHIDPHSLVRRLHIHRFALTQVTRLKPNRRHILLNKHVSLSGTVPRHTAHWETHSSQCGNDLLFPTWWSNGKHSFAIWRFRFEIWVRKPIHFVLVLVTSRHVVTNSIEQSPSSEVNRSSASQEIPCILCNPKVYYCIHKRPPLVSSLSHISLVHTSRSHFLKIRFNIILPTTSRSFKWSPFVCYTHLLSPPYVPHAPPI